jgi:hypothetical protein
MAGVVVDKGPVTATDRLRDVPQSKWHDLMLARRAFLARHLSYDCRCLVEFVDDAQAMFRPLGFANVEALILDGYGLEPAEIELAVEWLRLNPPAEPLAINMAKTMAEAARADPKPTHAEAGAKGGRGKKAATVRRSFRESTESRSSLLRRLARDAPDVLDAFERGEHKSARAAAIAAGILKPPTPLADLRRAWKKASAEQRATFRESICG